MRCHVTGVRQSFLAGRTVMVVEPVAHCNPARIIIVRPVEIHERTLVVAPQTRAGPGVAAGACAHPKIVCRASALSEAGAA